MQILIQWVWEDLRFCTDNKLPGKAMLVAPDPSLDSRALGHVQSGSEGNVLAI